MNLATQSTALPNLTADLLSDPLMPVDNLLSRLWTTTRIPTLLARAGLNKHSSVPKDLQMRVRTSSTTS